VLAIEFVNSILDIAKRILATENSQTTPNTPLLNKLFTCQEQKLHETFENKDIAWKNL